MHNELGGEFTSKFTSNLQANVTCKMSWAANLQAKKILNPNSKLNHKCRCINSYNPKVPGSIPAHVPFIKHFASAPLHALFGMPFFLLVFFCFYAIYVILLPNHLQMLRKRAIPTYSRSLTHSEAIPVINQDFTTSKIFH